MKRKRIARNSVFVTQASITDKVIVGQASGKPAIKRHSVSFDKFRGVKVPKNVGVCVFEDIAHMISVIKHSDLLKETVKQVAPITVKRYESGIRPLSK